ncbi:MAG TPA: hypothetical protein VF807_11610 [Ktedonobacterales bacterium]
MMLRLRSWQRWAFVVVAVLAVAALILSTLHRQGTVHAAGGNSSHDVGDESHELERSIEFFSEQRAAPADVAPSAAWPAAMSYVKGVAVTSPSTPWTEVGPKNYFTDDPNYVDPAHSNSGAGAGYVSGRITALAATKNGQTVFAGGADGGVWKSTDAGQHWAPVFDTQDTTSIGALAIDETSASGSAYTVYAGTGEANTSGDSYAGIGILKSSDGGASWSRVGGNELNGALIYRIAVDPVDHTRLYAATSHGLFRWTAGASGWARVLGTSTTNLIANFVTDVVVRPGTGGASGDVIAVIGWRGGAATNGLYESTNGGDSFTAIANPQGYVSPGSQGRVTLAYAGDGSKLYAVVQSADLFNKAVTKTILDGIYVSNTGSPQGPFTKVAESSKLASSGSAMKVGTIGKGYQPGVQAWYNQFLAVDPADPNHVYAGLEEVYETTNGGASWTTIGPYWNFGFPCFTYNPFPGTCQPTTHSDQHAVYIANGTVWVGNDGGVWSRSLANHQEGNWTNLNRTLGTLQFYYADGGQAASGPLTLYGGLQDNGTAKVILSQGFATQPFGGDGGDVVVDPANPNNVMTEYVGLTIAKSTDGGHTWTDIIPADPNPRFIAPFVADSTNLSHLVAGGQYVWESTNGFNTVCNSTTCDWKIVFNQGAGHTTTALATAGSTTYAAWCGPCNPSFSSGTGFKSGIATNYGGTWHQLTPPLATRYPTGVTIDPANPAHAYVTYSGYSRHWIIGPLDPGVGHVFETSDGGATWNDISGDLVDAPANAVAIVGTHLAVGTDVGVYVAGLHGGTWQRLGMGLPNVVVNDLRVVPGGILLAATHGRGLWTIPTSAVA